MDHTVQEGNASSPIQSKDLCKDENEDHGNEHTLFVEICTNALYTVRQVAGYRVGQRTESPTWPIA